MNKYTLINDKARKMIILFKACDNVNESETMAFFVGDNRQTNAQKVCDLLNETSRSQGKHT